MDTSISTNLRGDIAEQAAILRGLKAGWGAASQEKRQRRPKSAGYREAWGLIAEGRATIGGM